MGHYELSRSEGPHNRPFQRKDPIPILREAQALRRAVADFRPDVVHAHMVTGALLARALKRQSGFSLVCSVHNEWQRHATVMRVGDAVVAVSEANRRALEARGIPAAKLYVVKNGTLGSPRLTGSDGTADLSHPAITCVAGLFERKGIPELVTAFERLPESLAAHLYLVGEGPYRPELEERVRESRAGNRIHLEGFQPDPGRYLRATDLFVLASRREPFGLVLAEARQAGCAIVGTDVDGIPEALEGGRAGALVPGRRPGCAGGSDAVAARGRGRAPAVPPRRPGRDLDWLGSAHMADRMLAVYDEVRGRSPQASVDMIGSRARHFARHPLRSALRLGTHALVRRQTDGRVVSGPFAGMW